MESGEEKMRQPGVEPGAKAWEASMLPIHHWRMAGKKPQAGLEPAISASGGQRLIQATRQNKRQAGLAQLAERWSHNPKVVSSILTPGILRG